MSQRRRAVQAGRRGAAIASRIEAQTYDYIPGLRLPRPAGGSNYLCCQVSSALNAATGSFPSLTPGQATNQQIYAPSQNSNTNAFSLTAIASTNSTVLNYTNSTFNTGKLTYVVPAGLGNVFCVVTQDC